MQRPHFKKPDPMVLFALGLILLSATMLILTSSNATASPLRDVQWQKRPIVLFTDSINNPVYARQLSALKAARLDLEEREQIVLSVIGDTAGLTIGSANGFVVPSAAALRNHYAVGAGDFQLLLIGKDGGVKRRSSSYVTPLTLFCQVDAMPMRQSEMRAAGTKSAC